MQGISSNLAFWREQRTAVIVFLVTVFLSLTLSVGLATTVGTNIDSTGTIGVATTTPSQELGIVGDIFLTGGIGVNDATTSAGGIVADHADFGMLQVGTGSAISKFLHGTCAINPPALKAQTATTTACAATGVTTSSKVMLTPPFLEWQNDGNVQGSLVFVAASSTATNVIRVQVGNSSTSTAVDGASATWSWFSWQ
ncbi:MAG: hypothetical protein A3C84_00120 [Candidatus Ryanbacteria bacterium RIFCSPHIGHO2_02_FULL_48_12]|jgi:hypothetical protein|uniref:Uncharacterized protein n=1 Tax=Candidatus Ryanbacteria bacterium RIFCSPHIGHO2_01_FULL_48_27 TaxID=1802115 RepID=A0A1G2G6F1_9BACT|nr:MAG: hypothetical protein A2756_00315 [Candidatus Ryanbacteria bacterium RIFCSPHIGHO2_01_FULL_48_27]OGZ50382.1 MAG: hypothetical protein A3C84_00120 [Candidatus Ryanbacteria bacterium RIFCSPHIGHO2_02_FULL_48_12]